MTDTEKLCQDIAELEKEDGETVRRLSGGRLLVEGNGCSRCVPAYLTDPAETGRMFVALLELQSRRLAMGNNGEVLIDDFRHGETFEGPVAKAS